MDNFYSSAYSQVVATDLCTQSRFQANSIMPGLYSPSSDGFINWPSKETSVYYATLLGSFYAANFLSAYLKDNNYIPSQLGDYGSMVAGGASMLVMAMAMHYLVYNVLYADESIL